VRGPNVHARLPATRPARPRRAELGRAAAYHCAKMLVNIRD
jgi:hypothetical protein